VAVLLGTVKAGLFRSAGNEPVSCKMAIGLLVVCCAQRKRWSHVTHLGADERTDRVADDGIIFEGFILAIDKAALEVTVFVLHAFEFILVALNFVSASSIAQPKLTF